MNQLSYINSLAVFNSIAILFIVYFLIFYATLNFAAWRSCTMHELHVVFIECIFKKLALRTTQIRIRLWFDSHNSFLEKKKLPTSYKHSLQVVARRYMIVCKQLSSVVR